MVMDCVFCKIASGDLNSHKVYEDDDFMAFHDINPLNPGHLVVIPKEHNRWVWDLTESESANYFRVCNKIANAQREALDTEKVVSLIVGEEISHAHILLIPRFEDDGHGSSIDLSQRKDLSDQEMEQVSEKIRQEL